MSRVLVFLMRRRLLSRLATRMPYAEKKDKCQRRDGQNGEAQRGCTAVSGWQAVSIRTLAFVSPGQNYPANADTASALWRAAE
jgi:hypothetical protein